MLRKLQKSIELMILVPFSIFVLATQAFGETGIGIAFQDSPSLSVLLSPNNTDNYHIQGHYSDNKTFVTTDFQKMFTPDFGYGPSYKTQFYSGAGAKIVSLADNPEEESFYMRIPVGVQFTWRLLRIQLFSEVVGELGALPKTNISGHAYTGLRAYF